MKFLTSAVALILLLAGCANKSVQPLPQDQHTALKGKHFDIIHYDAPLEPFVMTPGKALFFGFTGLIGGALYATTDTAVHENELPSTPSHFVSTDLAKMLSSENDMVWTTHPNIIFTDPIDSVPESYKDVDYVIDIRDKVWSVNYYRTHWGSYKVMYEAQLKVYDVRTNRIIGESYCEFDPEYTDDAPDYDSLFEHNALGLKNYSKTLFKRCADQFYSDLFSARPAGS
ncbi:hypothetical protein ACXWTF_03940 [Thiomicrolovo sp. ZZH C-3]